MFLMNTTIKLLFIFKRKRKRIFFLLSFVLLQTNLSFASNSNIKISIPLLDWSSQRVISKSIGAHLSKHQYNVHYKTMPEHDLWGSQARGIVHFQIEVWQASAGRESQLMVDKKRFIELGKHTAKPIEEWWYPLFVEELCPGLPDWTALLECSHIFADPPSTKGVYHLGPWEYNDADLIRSLGLNFTIEKHNSIDEIWRELKEAQASKKPIILLNWTPNWTDQRIPGKFVQFPKYHPQCETDASWGVNSKLKYDCANIKEGWIKKTAWAGLLKHAPCVYQLIENMDLTNEMIAEAAALVIFNGLNEEQASIKWLDKYQKSVDSWSADGCLSTL